MYPKNVRKTYPNESLGQVPDDFYYLHFYINIVYIRMTNSYCVKQKKKTKKQIECVPGSEKLLQPKMVER